jgi:hypothetical protein
MTILSGKNYHFLLLKIFEDDDTAQILDLDDGQVYFDPTDKQIRINLTGEQTNQLNRFGWYRQPAAERR